MARAPIRGLTLIRPWDWAILHGGKRIENRTWAPKNPALIGSYLALHAGKGVDDLDAVKFIAELAGVGVLDIPGPEVSPTGIVGVARLALCVHESSEDPAHAKYTTDPWFVGPWGWVLDQVVAFKRPVPCKGALGLWTLSDELLAVTRERWREVRDAAA